MERIDAMAKRLSDWKNTSATMLKLDDMALSIESIELMLGVDTAGLHVISNTDTPVEPAIAGIRGQDADGQRWFTLDLTVRVFRFSMSGAAVASSCICLHRWMATAICCRRSVYFYLQAGLLRRT